MSSLAKNFFVKSARPKVFKYRRQSFYAERGIIFVRDEGTSSGGGDFRPTSRKEFLERARAFAKERARCSTHKEWMELQNMIDDMVLCARQAKQQGDPSDDATLDYMMRHKRNNRVSLVTTHDQPPQGKPKNLILPGSSDFK